MNGDNSSKIDDYILCEACKINIPKRLFPAHTRSNLHKNNVAQEIHEGVYLISNAFNNSLNIYRIQKTPRYDNQNCVDFDAFFLDVKNRTLSVTADRLKEHPLLKVNFELFCLYVLKKSADQQVEDEDDSSQTFDIKSFKSGSYRLMSASTDLEKLYRDSCDRMTAKAIEFNVSNIK